MSSETRSTGSYTLPSMSLCQHLGLADGQLEALPAHQLDEYGQGELAAALNFPGVRPLRGQHPDRNVADELGVETALQQPGCELGALLAGQRGRY